MNSAFCTSDDGMLIAARGLGGACGGMGRSGNLLQLDSTPQASRRIGNGFLPPDRKREDRSFILFIAALSDQDWKRICKSIELTTAVPFFNLAICHASVHQ